MGRRRERRAERAAAEDLEAAAMAAWLAEMAAMTDEVFITSRRPAERVDLVDHECWHPSMDDKLVPTQRHLRAL